MVLISSAVTLNTTETFWHFRQSQHVKLIKDVELESNEQVIVTVRVSEDRLVLVLLNKLSKYRRECCNTLNDLNM